MLPIPLLPIPLSLLGFRTVISPPASLAKSITTTPARSVRLSLLTALMVSHAPILPTFRLTPIPQWLQSRCLPAFRARAWGPRGRMCPAITPPSLTRTQEPSSRITALPALDRVEKSPWRGTAARRLIPLLTLSLSPPPISPFLHHPPTPHVPLVSSAPA